MKRKTVKVLLEFDVPTGVAFVDIRDFITRELESGGGNRDPDDPLFHSLGNVRVSKPITTWRDPAKKKIPPIKIVKLETKQGA